LQSRAKLTARVVELHRVDTVDFRSVYQTLIRDWLQGDAATVLRATYPELPLTNAA
jgi:hypothetical protein